MNKKIHKKSKNHWTVTIWTNLVETHPRHIPTKFEVDLASGFGEEVENVNCGRTTDDDGRRRQTILKVKSIALQKWTSFGFVGGLISGVL